RPESPRAASDGLRGARRSDADGHSRPEDHGARARIAKTGVGRTGMNCGRLAAGGCLLVLAACSGGQQSADVDARSALGSASVATVNGEALPESLYRYYVLNVQRKNPAQLSPAEREQALEEISQVKLLADAGLEAGLHNERTIAAELELQRLQLLARRMALRYLETNPPTEGELRAIYERSLPQLAPTEYKVRNILVTTEEEARAAIGRLRDG